MQMEGQACGQTPAVQYGEQQPDVLLPAEAPWRSLKLDKQEITILSPSLASTAWRLVLVDASTRERRRQSPSATVQNKNAAQETGEN